MEISKRKLTRYLLNPNYVPSFYSYLETFAICHYSNTLNPCYPQTPPSSSLLSQNPNSKPIILPLCSSISSSGSFSFCYATSHSLRSRYCYPGFALGLTRLHGQSRFISVSSSDENSDVKNMTIVDSAGKFRSNITVKNISDIVEAVRSAENDLESRLNVMNVCLRLESLQEIFCVLNGEKICALPFFVWARCKDPRLHRNADLCSLIIDNCGWLNDYETMLCLLKDFKSKGICLTERAFGFLPRLFLSKELSLESIRRVVDILKEAGGSCYGSGICGLLKMLSKLDMLGMAKFVMELTERKVSYYNILIHERCCRCCFKEARHMLEEMRQFGCYPDAKTYNYVVSALCKHDRMAEACNILEEMREKHCPPDVLTYEIFIHFSFRVGKSDYAVQFLDQMTSGGIEPRLATHAAFIKGFFYSRQYKEAHNYVVDAAVKYKKFGNMIYGLLAGLHQKGGDLLKAGNILIEMMDKGLVPNFPVYIRISKELYKCGRKQLARDLKIRFSRLRVRVNVDDLTT